MMNNSKKYVERFEVEDHETISIEEAILLNNERYKKTNNPMDLVPAKATRQAKKKAAPKVAPIDLAKAAQITALTSFYFGKYGSLSLSEFLKDMQANDDLPALSIQGKSTSDKETISQLLHAISQLIRSGGELMSGVDNEEELYIAYDDFNEAVLTARAILLNHEGRANEEL